MKKITLIITCFMLAIVSGCGDNNQNNNQSSNDNPSDSVVKWNMTSTFATNLNTIGEGGVDFVNRIDLVSNGTIKINIFEPGALVPALEAFDAVSSGAVDAAWSTAGYWAGKISAVQFFSAVPFGPNATEFIAWYHEGGGKEIWEELMVDAILQQLLYTTTSSTTTTTTTATTYTSTANITCSTSI